MLGMILDPYGQVPNAWPSEIGYSYGGAGRWLCPDDPQYYTRGEAGFYHDTPLGAIPTDFELSTVFGYLPVESGWVAAKEGQFPAPYRPPNNWGPAGPYDNMPRPFRPGLHGPQDLGIDPNTPITALDPQQAQYVSGVLDAMNSHNQRMFTLAIVSTFAVAVSAFLTVIRTSKLIREESKKGAI